MGDTEGLAWGRAAFEPTWLIWANRAGIVACVWTGCIGRTWLAAFLSTALLVFVGLSYLFLTFRALRLGYVQPQGVVSLAAYRDRKKHGF